MSSEFFNGFCTGMVAFLLLILVILGVIVASNEWIFPTRKQKHRR